MNIKFKEIIKNVNDLEFIDAFSLILREIIKFINNQKFINDKFPILFQEKLNITQPYDPEKTMFFGVCEHHDFKGHSFFFSPLKMYKNEKIYNNCKIINSLSSFIKFGNFLSIGNVENNQIFKLNKDDYGKFLILILDKNKNKIIDMYFENDFDLIKEYGFGWDLNLNSKFYFSHNYIELYKDNFVKSYFNLPNINMSEWSLMTRIFIGFWKINTNIVNSNYELLDKEIEQELKLTVTESKYTIYRGLSWNLKHNTIKVFLESIKYTLYTIGDSMLLNVPNMTSWSKKEKIANAFATRDDYGILLKMTTESKNVLCDISGFEDEMIILPNTYKVEIVKLYKNKKQITNMKEWYDF